MNLGNQMNKKERIIGSINGNPVDRPPYGFWGHHFDAEHSLASHLSSVLWWQNSFDMDFIKVQGRASYPVEDWGVRFRYPPIDNFVGLDPDYHPRMPSSKKAILESYPVKTIEDMDKLQVLSPYIGALGERLLALRTIKYKLQKTGRDMPLILETLFNPISLAGHVLGWGGGDYAKLDLLKTYLETYPEKIHSVLNIISETVENYVKACLQIGVDGFFFATTHWGTYDRLSKNEYDMFARPYDLRVINSMQDAVFNILHVCKDNIMLYDLLDYPIQTLNWNNYGINNPSLKEVLERAPDKAVLGGIFGESLCRSNPEIALQMLRTSQEETGGRRWIVGPECSIPPEMHPAALQAVVEGIKQIGQI